MILGRGAAFVPGRAELLAHRCHQALLFSGQRLPFKQRKPDSRGFLQAQSTREERAKSDRVKLVTKTTKRQFGAVPSFSLVIETLLSG